MSEIINYLGVDWGEKRIGLATADSDVRLSLPFKTVSSLKELLQIIKEEEINCLVIGDPIKMGGASANNPLWLDFMAKLRAVKPCRIELLDERLSSLAADAKFGSKKDKAGRDEIAASIILQDYLDGNINS